MGNTQSNDKVEKVISTCWLGVNDDWVSIMKDRISRIKNDWAPPVMQSLDKFSHKEQRRFQKQVHQALNYNSEDSNKMLQQAEEFLCKNEFLREGLTNRPSSQEPTLSTSYNSLSRINESNSVSYQTEPNEEITKIVSQYYLVITIINDMVTNDKHPFNHMINAFHVWSEPILKDLQNGNSTIQKQKTFMFAKSTNEFLEYMIVALNEYLGDIDTVDLNPHLKDKQRYFNYFLSKVIGENQTKLLLESLKLVYKHHISTLQTKMESLQQYSFEIPKKYLTPQPFQTQIDYLKEIQNHTHPASKYNCLFRTTQCIKEQLSRSASNYFLLQVTNYVVIHCQIVHLQAEVQLVELFYPNSVVQRFLQSLDFIQNIIIS